VLCHFRLRTSLKPSSWMAADFGVLDWPAGLHSFSTAFNSCRATVYMPYRALNRFFPLRNLQKFCLFSSAVLMVDNHCSLSPTEAAVYLPLPRCRGLLQTAVSVEFKVKVTLRPTVSRPFCLGIKHPDGV
jgi:hypothetical protein